MIRTPTVRFPSMRFLALLLGALLALALASVALAQLSAGDELIVGGEVVVEAGEIFTGNLTTVGATVELRPGSTLAGRLTAIGGTLTIDGTVTGVVDVYGGGVELGDSARIVGDLSADFASVERADGAVVTGTLREGAGPAIRFEIPDRLEQPVQTATRIARPVGALGMIARVLFAGLVAALLAALIPTQLERVRKAALERPLRSAGIGFLGILAVAASMIILAITIIGIPVALLVGFASWLAVVFGTAALGLALGRWLASYLDRPWPMTTAAAAGAATLALVLVVLGTVPAVGGLAEFVVTLLALGAVIATRAGTRATPPPASAAPSAPAQPQT